jgi:hypothetical protein
MRIIIGLLAGSYCLLGSDVFARQFECRNSDETGSVVMDFDSTKPLFEIKITLADGTIRNEKLLSPSEACGVETTGLACKQAERTHNGQYSYSLHCGSAVRLHVYLDKNGAGQISCRSLNDPDDYRIFSDCR